MKDMNGWRGSDPTNMLIIPTETVTKVAATTEVTVFVTACGRLYIGHYNGKDKGSLKLIDLGNKWVQDAALYKGLIVFATDKGTVYSLNTENESRTLVRILEPKKTCSHGKEESGKAVFIQQVSAGLDHIIFLSSDKELWVQGKGPALGLFTNKTENEITNPTRVDFFKGRRIIQAVAGHYFTIALVEALPPIQNGGFAYTSDPLPDFDSYVKMCDLCRKETGDRVLFKDAENIEKCPLGLGVQKDVTVRISDFLSPTYSISTNLDRRLSQSSNFYEEGESSDYINDDFDFTSGETSCDGTTLNTPIESKTGMEMKNMNRHRKFSVGSFEVVENDIDKLCIENVGEKSVSTGALSMTRDAAKQFFSRPLSWVTSTSIDSESFSIDTEKFSYKYPIDSATELIKENVVSAASLVATSVRTVGDKVGQLSRHFSSSDCAEGNEQGFSPDGEALNIDMFTNKPLSKINKSESYDWNSFPRLINGAHNKKTHTRTGSIGMYHTRTSKDGLFVTEKNKDQIENNKRMLIEMGKNLLNTEVWGWGSSNKGQLGLGDHTHRTTPTNITVLNHSGIVKVVCGSHHTAVLTVDGQVYYWGYHTSTHGSSTPRLLLLPLSRIVKDVASGDDFLIVISLDGCVFYVNIKSDTDLLVKEIPISDTSSFHSVLCQSQSIVCTTEDINSKITSFLHSESTYLAMLKKTVQHIVLPFLNLCNDNNSISNNSKTNYSQSNGLKVIQTVHEKIQLAKLLLLKSYLSLTYVICTTLYSIKECQSREITEALPIINQVEELKSVYREYITLVCDALAFSGLTLETKDAELILEKSKNHFDSLPEQEVKTHTNLFSYLLMLPLRRIEEYERFLIELRNDTDSFYSPFSLDKIKMAYTHWKQLVVFAHNSKVDSENTRSFWNSCAPKLFEALATPDRRLIRDSRKTPVNLLNAGRFSSHSFILLSDVLIHNTYNNFVTYNLSSMWVEALPNLTNGQNIIQITVPEETISLVCPNPLDKGQWLQSLQDGIIKSIQSSGDSVSLMSRSPPLVRTATYTFAKHPQYKDATYSGHWFCGKMHGEGTLNWPDGKRYSGQFRHNVYQGFGKLDVPNGGTGFNTFEGCWRNGKLEGRGVIRYANKNIYVGFLKESQPHGHGELKKGKFSSEAASVYTGEWTSGAKHGYGVLDEIAQGEKYHGMWMNNNRHGPGMVVTMNDIYYEGNFSQNKLTGYGLMILEDGTSYEGELGPGGTCSGKGTLSYPNGDYIEGTFSGSWAEGIKVNGVLHKGNGEHCDHDVLPKSFGKFSVPSHQKWTSLFRHCEDHLGIISGAQVDTAKVWQTLASFIEAEKQHLLRSKGSFHPLDGLDKIPEAIGEMTLDSLIMIQLYLEKAFASMLHPLGQLMQSLVGAFRATYGGVVAHPRLLKYAVQEVWSCSSRLYQIVRFLFPVLPVEGENLILEQKDSPNDDIIVSAAYVIHPWLLPHLYATLSPLYVRHHQRKDGEYWQRLLKWNKQSDIALMTFLGVDMKFWLLRGETLAENGDALSVVDQHFTEAVETLQLLSTSFTPKDKLLIIRKCGILINQEVIVKLGQKFVLSMDDLLPLFLYVVVRARIQHLGAEIGLIDDLIDPHLQNGELDHVFTTLKACYFHILHEKPTTIL